MALVLGLLTLACLAAGIVSLGTGAVALSPARVVEVLAAGRPAKPASSAPTSAKPASSAPTSAGPASGLLARDSTIVLDIRLPRTLVGLLVGAALATAGALLQGLFRNPLADPGFVGVSSGSAFAAACVIVLGHRFMSGPLPFPLLPAASFLGALAATSLLYAIGTRRGRTSVATMLLAGIALTALASSGTGFLSFLSDDRQLRDLSFWTLGSLGGATWSKLAAIAPMIGAVLVAAGLLARALNALVLGEAEAFHLGVAVERTKRLAILIVAVAVGASVATAGLITFVGLIVPHAIRLAAGSDHRLLVPAAALGGGALLVTADTIARIVVAPAELPIGIVTSLIGAPYFLWLLLRRGATLDA